MGLLLELRRLRRARFWRAGPRYYDLLSALAFGAQAGIPTMPKLVPPIEPSRMQLSAGPLDDERFRAGRLAAVRTMTSERLPWMPRIPRRFAS